MGEDGASSAGEQPREGLGTVPCQLELVGDLGEAGLDSVAQGSDGVEVRLGKLPTLLAIWWNNNLSTEFNLLSRPLAPDEAAVEE